MLRLPKNEALRVLSPRREPTGLLSQTSHVSLLPKTEIWGCHVTLSRAVIVMGWHGTQDKLLLHCDGTFTLKPNDRCLGRRFAAERAQAGSEHEDLC